MNFIGMVRQEENSVELKYCERCGGLWLRRTGMMSILRPLPRSTSGTAAHRPGRDSNLAGTESNADRSITGVAEMEVRP